MSDSFIETTHTGWGSRIVGSILGFLLGPLLIIACGIGLFWNEGRAVQTQRSLTEGAGVVVDIDPARVDPANEGKLVHATADLAAPAPVGDPDFGVTTAAMRLVRAVEMYQWKEEKKSETHKNVGGSEDTVTTYTYAHVWSDRVIDSHHFKQPDGHQNPQMRYQRAVFTARDISFGAFHPSDRVVGMLPASSRVAVDPALAEAVRGKVAGPVQVTGGLFYFGADPQAPQVGDQRISYRAVPAGPASIIGRQADNEFTDYQTAAGDRLLMARPGRVSAAEMFKIAQHDNVVLTWILRGVGALVMFFGFFLLLRPIVVVADVIPFLGSMLGVGVAIAALLATIVVAALVVAVAWMWYRPLVSIGVLVVGAVLVFALKKLAPARRKPTPALQAAGPGRGG